MILIIVGGTLGKIYVDRINRPQQSFLISQEELEKLLEKNREGSDPSTRSDFTLDTIYSIQIVYRC